jgi:hypothetical protein
MFYARINKIRIFSNREGFLGLFDRAEVQIYSLAGKPESTVKLEDLVMELAEVSDDKKEEAIQKKLLDAVKAEAKNLQFLQKLPIRGVRDNEVLTFGDEGIQLYKSETTPDELGMHVWLIELDNDIRDLALTTDDILKSTEFKTLLTTGLAALAVKNPLAVAAVSLTGLVFRLVLKKLLSENRNDLIGYWHETLNRSEHYPHGIRNREDVPDSTRNMLVDYTLFSEGARTEKINH